MNENEIKEQVIHSIREIIRKRDIQIDGHTKLVSDLGLESIDFIDLIFECERKIGVEIELSHFAIPEGENGHQRFQDIDIDDIVKIVVHLLKNKDVAANSEPKS